MVTEEAGTERVVGVVVYELHKAKLHVVNFAVDPAFRRRGVGSAMAAKLVGKLSSDRRTRISLDVRETNLAAQLFFRGQGFRAVRVDRGLFEDSGEDGYRMVYRLPAEEGIYPSPEGVRPGGYLYEGAE